MRTILIIAGLGLGAVAMLAASRTGAQELAPGDPAPELATAHEVVAEALFLVDALPAGGRDLNVSLMLAEAEPDPVTAEVDLAVSPRVQLAMPFADGRLGFTVDVGIGTTGDVLETPGASLKLLLRSPEAGRTGLAASLDLFGSFHSLSETEGGAGLNAIRAFGPITLRACAGLASGIRSWSPHFHGGFSGALALGSRWRALAELSTDVSGGRAVVSAGPTLKVAIGERTAVMAGALFQVAPAAGTPVFVAQLTRSL